ncbi:IS982 family transposase [Candidatus Parcubacteria bacterium]|nr:MAG: IS982 family transposase [Candidatus Parcubacteria bacterium]
MDDKIIATYCLCDDLLRALRHRDDPQCQMTDAEVLTTALVAALCLRGNLESARMLLKQYGYMPRMLSKSRFHRRLHRCKDRLLLLFHVLGELWKALNQALMYVIASFPLAACDNIRIRREKRLQHASYRGYIASKRRYFYGLKLHLMITKDGQPIEFFLTPGSFSDVEALHYFTFDLPAQAQVHMDKASNNYAMEDLLHEAAHIRLLPLRKKHAKRVFPPYVTFMQHYYRKKIETVGSLIERMRPKSIHAVTAEGLALKVVLFVVAYSLSCCFKDL